EKLERSRRNARTALGAQIISLNRESRCGCGLPCRRAKTNLPDTESSSPGRQKATSAGSGCIPQLHEAKERDRTLRHNPKEEPRGLPGDPLHP
ncbi:hypothetical protein ALC60_10110, partial [Trachymyrmex zeteki]